MIRLIKNSLLFFVVLLLADKLFLPVRAYAPDFQEDKRLEQLFEGEIDKDLIVIGSSRGPASIATWNLEKKLDLDAYNLSYGGTEIEMHYFLLDNLLKHNTAPKVILKILDDSFELTKADMNNFRFDLLYPLVKYPIVREELIQRGEKDRILSTLFITHQISKSAFDFRTPRQWGDTLLQFGTMPKRGMIKSKEVFGAKADTEPYDQKNELEIKLKAFKNFQALAAANDIKLVYVIPPSFRELNQDFLSRMRELITPENGLFVYDDQDLNYRQREIFGDPYHLNRRGAEYFTEDLIEYLKLFLEL